MNINSRANWKTHHHVSRIFILNLRLSEIYRGTDFPNHNCGTTVPGFIDAEYFQGYGSPFLLRRCQGPEHPKISPKTPFLCHNFGQAMSKWLLGDVKLAEMASGRCQTQNYEEPRSWDPRVSACLVRSMRNPLILITSSNVWEGLNLYTMSILFSRPSLSRKV